MNFPVYILGSTIGQQSGVASLLAGSDRAGGPSIFAGVMMSTAMAGLQFLISDRVLYLLGV